MYRRLRVLTSIGVYALVIARGGAAVAKILSIWVALALLERQGCAAAPAGRARAKSALYNPNIPQRGAPGAYLRGGRQVVLSEDKPGRRPQLYPPT